MQWRHLLHLGIIYNKFILSCVCKLVSSGPLLLATSYIMYLLYTYLCNEYPLCHCCNVFSASLNRAEFHKDFRYVRELFYCIAIHLRKQPRFHKTKDSNLGMDEYFLFHSFQNCCKDILGKIYKRVPCIYYMIPNKLDG